MIRRLVLALLAALGLGAKAQPAPKAVHSSEGTSIKLALAPVPANAAALAEKAVEAVRKVDGATLDYSPASLKKIDELILGFKEEGLGVDRIGSTVFIFGCYVGEVFVRHDGAHWVMPDEAGRQIGFEMMGIQLKDGKFINPIGKAMKLLENGMEDSVAYSYVALHAPAVKP